MPLVRTSKGNRTSFTEARLSALLTLVWQAAHGEDGAARHRRDIQAATQRLWVHLVEAYGGHADDEWRGPDIGKVIGNDLDLHENWEIHEAWLTLKVSEFQDHENVGDDPGEQVLANQKKQVQKTLGMGLIDPIWGVLDLKDDLSKEAQEKTGTKTSSQLGEAIAPARGRGAPRKERDAYERQQTRSQWLDFWRWLAEEAGTQKRIPFGRWETSIYQQQPDRRLSSHEGWWTWWQERIDEGMMIDPRLHELRRLASLRRRRNSISGFSWLDGSTLCPDGMPLKLDATPTGVTWYRRLGVEHLKAITQDVWPALDWDWGIIGKALDPAQDERLTWSAIQDMDVGGALWIITKPWSNGNKPNAGARELPQWAIMRLSLAMAAEQANFNSENQSFEDDGSTGKERRSKDAVTIYECISKSHIVPTASMIREAGKLFPKWMDDGAWWVGDDYGGMQEALHETALGTVWKGSRALDLGAVRSRGAPVRKGHRAASGLPPIADLIEAQMAIQGREGVDRPVTLCVPAWHRDLPELLEQRQRGKGKGSQLTVLASDLFIKRAIEGKEWQLLDPHAYPEAIEGDDGILKAEAEIKTRRLLYPNGNRVVDAARLLKSCVAHLGRGDLQINFTSVSDAFGPGKGKRIHGRDGIGTFFLPNLTGNETYTAALSWPALAINVVPLVDAGGNTHQALLEKNIKMAFELCERLYLGMQRGNTRLPPASVALRPACIGVIGLHEAVVAAREGNLEDIDDLASWIQRMAMLVGSQAVAADSQLAEIYGAAPAMDQEKDQGNPWRNFHPGEGYQRLVDSRGGGLGMRKPGAFSNAPEEPIPLIYGKSAPRYTSRLVWAPYQQAARWAGVSPGGFGTLFPYDWIQDEDGVLRQAPTPFLTLEMERLGSIHEADEFGAIFKHPIHPNRWPAALKSAVFPDVAELRNRIRFASGVRPWIDQGVSLTVQANSFKQEDLMTIIQQAWWYGVDNLRAEQRTYIPESRQTQTSTPSTGKAADNQERNILGDMLDEERNGR